MIIKKIVTIDSGYVRDTQVYLGNPALETNEDWESGENFTYIKYPRHFVGIFEGDSEDEIRQLAAKQEGLDPAIFTLEDIESEIQPQSTGKFYVLAGRYGVQFNGIYGSTDRNKLVEKMKELFEEACDEEGTVNEGTFCGEHEAYVYVEPRDCYQWIIEEFELYEKTTIVAITETKLGSEAIPDLYCFSSMKKAKDFLAEFILAEGRISRLFFELNDDDDEIVSIPEDIESIQKIIEDCGSKITIIDEENFATFHIDIKETIVDGIENEESL